LITIIVGGDDLMFDTSSAALKPRLVSILERMAPILAQLENSLQVHGHTDARPFPKGSSRSNWQLSFERADNARAVLDSSGVRKGQLQGVFAHGDTALVNTKVPSAPENRRLAILAVRRGFEKTASRDLESPRKPDDLPAAPPEAPAQRTMKKDVPPP
jgi:chemotaxis protein MotB